MLQSCSIKQTSGKQMCGIQFSISHLKWKNLRGCHYWDREFSLFNQETTVQH